MTLIQTIIISIVQGITEFIPISSSGHIVIINKLFGFQETSIIFDFTLHLGTLSALIWYYRKKLWEILKQKKLLIGLILSTIPVGIVFLIIRSGLETWANSILCISISLIIIGIVFLFLEKIHKNDKPISEMKVYNFLSIGAFESLALIRGVSRSGISIIGGILNGLKLKDAAEISFLIGIPAMLLGMLPFIVGEFNFSSQNEIFYAIIGYFLSFIIGLMVMRFFLEKISYKFMFGIGVYRIILGVMVLILNLRGVI